jgi:hypothetical protein
VFVLDQDGSGLPVFSFEPYRTLPTCVMIVSLLEKKEIEASMLQSNGAVLKFARARSALYLAYCLGVAHKLMCLDLAILITYELYNALKWSDPSPNPAQAGVTCIGLPFSCYCFVVALPSVDYFPELVEPLLD